MKASKNPANFSAIFSLLIFTILYTCTYSAGFVSSAAVSRSSSPRRSFGQICNETVKIRCDRRAALSCGSGGQCECSRPDETVFVPAVGKCVTRASERCKFVVNFGNNNNDDDYEDNNRDGGEKTVYEYVDCVPHAVCSPTTGFCTCNETTHFETLDGTCDPLRMYSEPCDEISKCHGTKGLTCDSSKGQCKCIDSAIELYGVPGQNLSFTPIVENGTIGGTKPLCAGLAGKPCVDNGTCVPNASCHGNNSTLLLTSTSNLTLTSVCECLKTFYQTDDGKCEPKSNFLGTCEKTEMCLGTAADCFEGKCDCDKTRAILGKARLTRNPEAAKEGRSLDFWDMSHYKSLRCLGLTELPCIDGFCTENAYCKYSAYVYENYYAMLRNLNGTCKCRDGYYPSGQSRLCKRGFRSGCKFNSDCIDGLVCLQRQCSCPFKTVQEFSGNHLAPSFCISQVRGPCTVDSDCWFRGYGKSVSNTECFNGHCRCVQGFVENATRSCDVAFSYSCADDSNNKIPCDTVAGLVCIDNKCRCGGFEEFNEEMRRCEGLVGATCDLPDPDRTKCPNLNNADSGSGRRTNSYGVLPPKKSPCGRNMECVPWFLGHPMVSVEDGGHCACKKGFSETGNYTCGIFESDLSTDIWDDFLSDE